MFVSLKNEEAPTAPYVAHAEPEYVYGLPEGEETLLEAYRGSFTMPNAGVKVWFTMKETLTLFGSSGAANRAEDKRKAHENQRKQW
jgi:hypothetical protein